MMELYKSKKWIDDLDTVLGILPEMQEMKGSTVMITGAGGLICSAVVDLFIRYNETHDEKIGIVVAGRSEKRMRERFWAYCDKPYFSFIAYDAAMPVIDTDLKVDYIIHGASNATPEKIVREPVETMMSNFNGMLALLRLAKEKQTRKVLFISSSEVYGKKESNEPSREDAYGSIDPLNIRNSYSIGKCSAEALCAAYAEEYGVNTSIVRPGHIYGPTASKDDNRVSSAWAYDTAAGKDIIMKSDGAQIRSYVYCVDCASAIIKVLLRGECKQAYNISNASSIISIRQMAQILCKAAKVSLVTGVPTANEKKGFNPMSNSSLDSLQL